MWQQTQSEKREQLFPPGSAWNTLPAGRMRASCSSCRMQMQLRLTYYMPK